MDYRLINMNYNNQFVDRNTSDGVAMADITPVNNLLSEGTANAKVTNEKGKEKEKEKDDKRIVIGNRSEEEVMNPMM